MVPNLPTLTRTQPVSLRVSDLAASREFFQELFGLLPAPEYPPTEEAVVLATPSEGGRQFCIKLTTAAVPVRLAGVHIELGTTNELLDLYFLALLGGFRTGELRFRQGSLSTSIIDPDGHVIQIEAHETAARFTRTPERQPWAKRRGRTPGRDAGEFGQEFGGVEVSRPADAGARARDEERREVAPRGPGR